MFAGMAWDMMKFWMQEMGESFEDFLACSHEGFGGR